MFTRHMPRPRPNLDVIHITPTNYRQVADYLKSEGLQVTIETPHDEYAPHLILTAPVGEGRTGKLLLCGRDVLIRYSADHYGVRQADMFEVDYQLADPVAGTNPEYIGVPRVSAAVQVLDDAGHPLACLVGSWKKSRPAHNVEVAGLVVRPLTGNRLRIDWTDAPSAPLGGLNVPVELEAASKAFAAAGYRVSARGGHLVAIPPQ